MISDPDHYVLRSDQSDWHFEPYQQIQCKHLIQNNDLFSHELFEHAFMT